MSRILVVLNQASFSKETGAHLHGSFQKFGFDTITVTTSRGEPDIRIYSLDHLEQHQIEDLKAIVAGNVKREPGPVYRLWRWIRRA